MTARWRWIAVGCLGGSCVAAVVVGVALAATGGSAATYTGCLSAKGAISKVKKGSAPIGSTCPTGATAIKLSGGDITGVAAGTGLTGGATSGNAALSLSPAYQIPQGCPDGSSPVAGSGVWTCGAGASKQFSFRSVSPGGEDTVDLGGIELEWDCTQGAVLFQALDLTGSGGSFNFFGVQNNSANAFQSGTSVPGDGAARVALNPGSSGDFVWDDADGNVTTGTVNWFYNTGTNTCEFEGDMIQPQS